jgi:hypothetical protein
MGLRMRPRYETFVTLRQGRLEHRRDRGHSHGVRLEFVAAPHERWAGLANACPCLQHEAQKLELDRARSGVSFGARNSSVMKRQVEAGESIGQNRLGGKPHEARAY